jgi:hypothetical protein
MARAVKQTVTDTDADERPVRNRVTDNDVRHEKYGGFHIGSAFFGWLVAVGLGTLLIAFLTAIGSATALTALKENININTSDPGSSTINAQNLSDDAQTIGLVSGVLVLLALMLAYYAGGYVAGRMSRFDGARQGFGVWLFAILITLVLALLGVLFGSEYNLLNALNLPRIPVDEGDLTSGGLITLILVLVLTAIAAIAGGMAGQKYHDRIDNTVADNR